MDVWGTSLTLICIYYGPSSRVVKVEVTCIYCHVACVIHTDYWVPHEFGSCEVRCPCGEFVGVVDKISTSYDSDSVFVLFYWGYSQCWHNICIILFMLERKVFLFKYWEQMHWSDQLRLSIFNLLDAYITKNYYVVIIYRNCQCIIVTVGVLALYSILWSISRRLLQVHWIQQE